MLGHSRVTPSAEIGPLAGARKGPAHSADLTYAGEPPRHGLGTQLEKAATAEEAIRAAGMRRDAPKVPRVPPTGSFPGTVTTPHPPGDGSGGPVRPCSRFNILLRGHYPPLGPGPERAPGRACPPPRWERSQGA